MSNWKSIALSGVALCLLASANAPSTVARDIPPADGFQRLFDGKSFDGWRGRPHLDPRTEAGWDATTKREKQAEWDQDRDTHWSIEQGELVSDGHGVFLTTEKEYADFELILDWKMAAAGDSGIYLRGSPQIQIWDPGNEAAHKHGSDKGSGALWNNSEGNPGKWPLVLADNAIGDWNRFRVVMLGSRVWVWLNDQLTVDGAILENYWDRSLPMFRQGVIQLQTHGSETRFRNIRLREVHADEANTWLAERAAEGLASIFDGKTWDGWAGPIENNRIEDGAILSKSGTIYFEKALRDFTVDFEFQLPPGGNNGLAIRYSGSGDTAYEGMCELQVLDSEHPKYAQLDDRQYHGSAYGMVAAHRGYLRPPQTWNYQRVTVEGKKIVVELNGTVILDADLADVEEFMGDRPHPGLEREEGFFGFAGHGDAVRYRRIRVR